MTRNTLLPVKARQLSRRMGERLTMWTAFLGYLVACLVIGVLASMCEWLVELWRSRTRGDLDPRISHAESDYQTDLVGV
jgi:hypothetical protein